MSSPSTNVPSQQQSQQQTDWVKLPFQHGGFYFQNRLTKKRSFEPPPEGWIELEPPTPTATAATATASTSHSQPNTVDLDFYQESEHWRGISQQLDQLDPSNFKFSKLPTVEYNGLQIPLSDADDRSYPSLLLYGLTDPGRYNGAAKSLCDEFMYRNWLLLQAVSGAGKTRAILDVFANGALGGSEKTLLYVDLSALERDTKIPSKNFVQHDVDRAGILLAKGHYDRKGAANVFRALFAARHMVISYLKTNKGWDAESLLFAQLALLRNSQVVSASAMVFKCIVGASDFPTTFLSNAIVAVDEASLVLEAKFGTFDSGSRGTQDAPKRPLLCCIGDALNAVSVIFSGTSFSHTAFDDAVISNVAGVQTQRFSSMTKMETVADVEKMLNRFRIDSSTVSRDTLELLIGRCRFVANSISKLISNNGGREEEIVLESIVQVQNQLSKMMAARLTKDPGSKALIQDLLVGTLLDRPKNYSDLRDVGKEWADKSFVWVSGKEQCVELNEPLLVRAAKDAYGSSWDPVAWILERMPTLSEAQQGYDFEQIAARKVAAALADGRLPIVNGSGETLGVESAPDEQTATTVKASPLFTLANFFERPQSRTIFLPANKDGPDVIFWVLCSGGRWLAVLIQAKYYQTPISGEKTAKAFQTVMMRLPRDVSALRIFFPFMGATNKSKPSILKDHVVNGTDIYMYLDHQNAGARVLGQDVCTALHQLKNKRKGAPA